MCLADRDEAFGLLEHGFWFRERRHVDWEMCYKSCSILMGEGDLHYEQIFGLAGRSCALEMQILQSLK